MTQTRIVLGAMTGTSLDGMDMALVEIKGTGLTMRARMVQHTSADLGEIGAGLRGLAEQRPATAMEVATLARDFGELHARMARELCVRAGVRPALACIHGQTVAHRAPLSWQLVNPWPVARELGCPVVFDLRGADLAEGGQGAPLTPLADWVLYRGADPCAVINLGGFANASFVPKDGTADPVAAIAGGDICPCNQLLDKAARLVLRSSYDEGGRISQSGECNAQACSELVVLLAPDRDAGAARSLGTGDEAWSWIERWHTRLGAPALLATLSDGIAEAIAKGIRRAGFGENQIILAGGGVHHGRLTAALARSFEAPVVTSDTHGIPAGQRESAAWAVLGALAQDRVHATVKNITGRKEFKLLDGCWCFPSHSS